MPSPAAVLFDFDGVLADTENVHVAAWQRTFSRLGWDESDECCSAASEIDDRRFIEEVFNRRGIPEDCQAPWIRYKQELTVKILGESPRYKPGARELVSALRSRTRLAVVSGTWRENIETVLRSGGLLDAFEFLIGKEDVRLAKPHPEPYLLALDRLGLPADSVVAIEDSLTGVASATGAGLRVIRVGESVETEPGANALRVVRSLRETPRILEILDSF